MYIYIILEHLRKDKADNIIKNSFIIHEKYLSHYCKLNLKRKIHVILLTEQIRGP